MVSFNTKRTRGDALSSQDEHISLIDYRPLLQLVRRGRQNIMFDRHPRTQQFHGDDYGRTNEITSPNLSAYPRGIFTLC